MFDDVSALFNAIAMERSDTEERLRLRAILLLRFLGLFRGCDLAKATRNVRTDSQPWFVWTQRKGRHHKHYPVHQVRPTQYCPHHALKQYLQSKADDRGTAERQSPSMGIVRCAN